MFVRGLDVSPIAAGRSAAAGTTLTTAQFGGSSSSTHNGPPATGPYSHRNVGGGYTSADHAPAIGGGSGYVHAGGIKNSRNFGTIRPTFPPSMNSTRTNLRALNVPSLYAKGGESVPTLKHVSKQDPRWDPKNTRTSFLSKDRRVTRNVVFGMGPPRPCSLPVLKSVSEEVLAGGRNPGGGASPAATRPRQAGASPPRGFVRQWVNVRQQLRRLSGDEPELPSAVVNPVPRDLNQRFPLVSDTPGPGRYNSKKSSYYPPPAGAGFLTLAGAPGAGGGEGAYNCVPPTMKAAGVEDGERPFFKDAKSGRSGKEALQCFGSFADRGLGPSASPSKNRVKVGNEGAGNSSCFSGGGKMKSMFKRTPQRQLVRNVSPTAQQELAAGGGGISAQPGGAGRGSERMLMKGGGGGQKQTVVGQLEGAIASKAGGPTGDVVWEKTLAAEGTRALLAPDRHGEGRRISKATKDNFRPEPPGSADRVPPVVSTPEAFRPEGPLPLALSLSDGEVGAGKHMKDASLVPFELS